MADIVTVPIGNITINPDRPKNLPIPTHVIVVPPSPAPVTPANSAPVNAVATPAPPPITNQTEVPQNTWVFPLKGTSTKVHVVLSKATGQVRRVIQCDSDEQYTYHESYLNDGEQLLYLSNEEHASFDGKLLEFKHHVAQKAGFPGAPDEVHSRHVHVHPDTNVINILSADLTCGDSVQGEGHKLIKHATAEIGWILDVDGQLVPPVSNNTSTVS